MRTRIALLVFGLFLFRPIASNAQEFRNLTNTRFNTVASGPMQALLVDVPDPNDSASVRQAVMRRVVQSRKARERGAEAYLRWLRRAYPDARQITMAIPEVVMLRGPDRAVVLPPVKRGRDANEITLAFPAAGQPGVWAPALQNDIQAAFNVLYSELKNVYGPPTWSGQLKVLNGDNLYPNANLSDPNVFWGGVFNASTHELYLAGYLHQQTLILNMAQSLLLAFRGSSSISYDAWERGMARAAGQIVVTHVLTLLKQTPSQAYGGTLGDIDLSDPFFNGLDRYDLLNQPPLGNDRFFPLSKENGQNSTSSFPLMMYNRLQMAGTAWLKVATADPSFFSSFNQAYYQALAGNPSLRNSVPALRALAKQVIDADTGISNAVEGLDFQAWYERQYALDTSVTPGTKLYSDFVFTRADPNSASSPDLYSVALILSCYDTTWDGTKSDENGVNATSYPIYWDYQYLARFSLGAQYEQIQFGDGGIDGVGTVTPGFPDTLGGDATLASRMRITIDIPVRSQYGRFYVAPRNAGPLNSPNNFWGVVVGANSGKIRIEADGLSSGDIDVRQGAFGAAVSTTPAFFSRPRRATVTFTPDGGGPPVVRQVVTGYREYVAVIYASDPVETRSHTFSASPAMVSFPIRPLNGKAAQALVDANGLPLFSEGSLLLAQWQQYLAGEDKYAKYPSIEALTPGKGYWFQFSAPLTVNIKGIPTNGQLAVSTPLVVGWNQIGNPYENPISVNDLVFQYRQDNAAVDLQTAVAKGWIQAATIPGDQIVVYGYDTANGYTKATALAPWTGYFINVLVSEGLTITYPNPAVQSLSASRSRAAAPALPSGWSLALRVHGPGGQGATCYLGQSDRGSTGYSAGSDALSPPPFSRAAPTIGFQHTDWGANSGFYLTDIRRSGTRATWEVTVSTPTVGETYTLTWLGVSRVPRTVQLSVTDLATGRRQAMSGSSGVSFVAGETGIRRFQISAQPRTAYGIRVSNVVARNGRAASSRTVSIGYDLSSDATVQIRIRGGDGRVLRVVDQGRAASAGTNTALWDTRDAAGVSVPAGMYLVEISAQSAEGEVARVSHPVMLIR